MKVYTIRTNTDALAVTPIGNRLYKVARDTRITAFTDEGNLVFDTREGFTTNFRSGGPLVDKFVDQIGDEKKSLCYLIHDLMYTPCAAFGDEHPVSRKFADDFLKAALAWAGMGAFKRNVVYSAVRLFGGGAYEDDDELTEANKTLFTFNWSAE